jgi:two-component system sensor histidine kinase PilS (NtrC family)
LANLAKKLKWLTLFRVVIVSFLFGATVIFNLEEGTGLLRDTNHIVLYYITTATFAVSFIYWSLLRVMTTETALVRLTYAQLSGDVALSAALVTITGGSDSVFTFFFSLTIVNAAIILYRRGAFIIASAASVFFVLIALSEMGVLSESLQFTEEIAAMPTSPVLIKRYITTRIYNVVINLLAFYSIAFLSSYLAEQVRRTSEAHHETQLSLEDLKALHHNIVSSIRSGLITIGLDRKITFFNQAVEELSGNYEGQVLGTDIVKVFPALRHILSNKDKLELLTVETTTQMLKGRSALLQWSISPLLDGTGKRIGQVLFVQDVTRVRDMEEQIERAEQFAVIGELAARIAHEIRNPLASISGCIQMLKSSQNDEDTSKRLMSIVLREIGHLNLWINDFLEFSRPSHIEKHSVDITRMLKETIEAFEHDDAMENSSVDVEARQQWLVKGDPVRLKQVFWNLLKNSSQAMPFGGSIHVVVEDCRHRGAMMIRASVSDQGVGISQEVKEQIFDPFFTTKQGGTGLGLATCFRIIQEHGGTIEVESELGQGSTFSVYLPQTVEA